MSIVSSTSRTCYQSSSMDPYTSTMYRQESSLAVSANVSGWRMEQVRVECRDRKLTLLLGGGSSSSSSSSGEGFSSDFTKSLCLPANVDIGAITTDIHNGMLTLSLPTVMSHTHNRKGDKMIMSPARRAVPRHHVVSSSRRHGRLFC